MSIVPPPVSPKKHKPRRASSRSGGADSGSNDLLNDLFGCDEEKIVSTDQYRTQGEQSYGEQSSVNDSGWMSDPYGSIFQSAAVPAAAAAEEPKSPQQPPPMHQKSKQSDKQQQRIQQVAEQIEQIDEQIAILKRRKEELLRKTSPEFYQRFSNDTNANNNRAQKTIAKADPAPSHSESIRASSVSTSSKTESTSKRRVSVFEEMKQGSVILKYGRVGAPHFRKFELSEDQSFIQWYSSGKSLNSTRLYISDIDFIQFGQLTTVFKRHLQPKLDKCSFSVLYKERRTSDTTSSPSISGNASWVNGPTKQRSLDLITKNSADFAVWTRGLNRLMVHSRRKLTGDVNTPPMCEALEIEVPERNAALIERGLSKQAGPPKDHVLNDLNKLRKKHTDLTRLIYQNSKDTQNKEFEQCKLEIAEVEGTIDNYLNLLDEKTTGVVAHEMWRTSVDLIALNEKVRALLRERGHSSFFSFLPGVSE